MGETWGHKWIQTPGGGLGKWIQELKTEETESQAHKFSIFANNPQPQVLNVRNTSDVVKIVSYFEKWQAKTLCHINVLKSKIVMFETFKLSKKKYYFFKNKISIA